MKCYLKVISVMAALCMMSSAAATNGILFMEVYSSSDRSYYSQDFEGLTELPDGWIGTGNILLDEDAAKGGTSLAIDKTVQDGQVHEVNWNIALDGGLPDTLVFEFNIKPGASTSAPYIYLPNNTVILSMIFNTGNKVTCHNGGTSTQIADYNPSEWSNVKICWSTANGTVNYIINDKLVAENYSLRNPAVNPAGLRIRFYVDSTRSGLTLLDDMKIYEAPPMLLEGVAFTDADGSEHPSSSVPVDIAAITAEFSQPISTTGAQQGAQIVSGGQVIPSTASVQGNHLILELDQLLGYETDYKVRITDNLKSIHGASATQSETDFLTGERPLKMGNVRFNNGVQSMPTSGAITAEFDIISSQSRALTGFLAIFAPDGHMSQVIHKKINVNPSVTHVTLTGAVSAGVDSEARLYLWDEQYKQPAENFVYTLSDRLYKSGETPAAPPGSGSVIVFSSGAYTSSYSSKGLVIQGDAAPNSQVTLLVTNPGKSLTGITDGDASSVLSFIGQTKSDGEGHFTFNVKLAQHLQSGDYLILGGGNDVGAFCSAALTYTGIDYLNTLLDDFSDAPNEQELTDLILLYADDFAIPADEMRGGELAGQLSGAVSGRMLQMPQFTTVNTFTEAYLDIYLSELFNLCNDVTSMLDKYHSQLEIERGEGSRYAEMKAQIDGLDAMLELYMKDNRQNKTRDDVAHGFNHGLMITAINSAGRGNIMERLLLFSDEIGLTQESINKYNNLSNALKNSMAVLLVPSKPYKSPGQINEAFLSGLSEATVSPPRKVTPTGGGGGGGGGIMFVNPNEPIVQTPTPTPRPETFTDIHPDEWHYPFIMELYDRGVVSGFGDQTFRPSENVTRAQFVKMLVAATGIYNEAARVDFSDVSEDSPYYAYIASAVQAGLILGNQDNAFDAEQMVTRQDMAVIAYRAISGVIDDIQEGQVGFSDGGQISAYALQAVAAMRQCGIINGLPDGAFEPHGFCTRAQAAKIICGVTTLIEEEKRGE